MKAIFPGTFDPPTLGHLDLMARMSEVCDFLYIALAVGHHKNPMFSLAERQKMLELTAGEVLDRGRFQIVCFDSLLIDLCRDLGVNLILRGVRDGRDFEYENRLFGVNHLLNSEIDTWYLPSRDQFSAISSEIAREVLRLDGEIEKILPAAVVSLIREKPLKQK